ncbi:hypothetical protein CSUI_007965, partial [Cystoisospora suis]
KGPKEEEEELKGIANEVKQLFQKEHILSRVRHQGSEEIPFDPEDFRK